MARPTENQPTHDLDNAAILALVNPPAACPSCYAKSGRHFPANATTRICPVCREEMLARSEALKRR